MPSRTIVALIRITWTTGFAEDQAQWKAGVFGKLDRPFNKRGVNVEPDIDFLELPWHEAIRRAALANRPCRYTVPGFR